MYVNLCDILNTGVKCEFFTQMFGLFPLEVFRCIEAYSSSTDVARMLMAGQQLANRFEYELFQIAEALELWMFGERIAIDRLLDDYVNGVRPQVPPRPCSCEFCMP